MVNIIVLKSGAFVNYGIPSAALEYTVSTLGTVNTTLRRTFVVSVVLKYVSELRICTGNGGNNFVTFPTSGNHIVATGSHTGCRGIIFLNSLCALGIVAERIDSGLCGRFSTTLGALSTVGKTGLGTSSVLAGNYYVGVVAKCRNGILFYSHSLTYGTLFTVGFAGGGTSNGIITGNNFFGMT